METSNQLSERLRGVLLSGKWIANTNYKDQISHLSWEFTTTKYRGLNSIAALTFHINYYLKGLIDFFETGDLTISDKYSFDMPSITHQEQWEELRNIFIQNAKSFIDHVASMDEEKLSEVFVDEKYGNYQRNIEAVIEHAYYHLGQISLIKKLLHKEDTTTL